MPGFEDGRPESRPTRTADVRREDRSSPFDRRIPVESESARERSVRDVAQLVVGKGTGSSPARSMEGDAEIERTEVEAAGHVGVYALADIVDEHGVEAVEECTRKIISHGEPGFVAGASAFGSAEDGVVVASVARRTFRDLTTVD